MELTARLEATHAREDQHQVRSEDFAVDPELLQDVCFFACLREDLLELGEGEDAFFSEELQEDLQYLVVVAFLLYLLRDDLQVLVLRHLVCHQVFQSLLSPLLRLGYLKPP